MGARRRGGKTQMDRSDRSFSKQKKNDVSSRA